jgi:ubiquinone/menaquinone biosynthesis C-methylase UbiE
MTSKDKPRPDHPSLLSSNPSLPNRDLLSHQAHWLTPARSRLLRRIGIAHRNRVLDLGAGYGSVTEELFERSNGQVIALDLSHKSLCEFKSSLNVFRIVGDAARLPCPDHSFDLVFCQVGLLWMKPIRNIVEEISRVLESGGVLLSIEPDFTSLIEYPPEVATRDIWISALERAGAQIEACREVPSILESLGFRVRVDLLERIHPPSPFRHEFLRELVLSYDEKEQLDQIELLSRGKKGWTQIVHLPYLLTTGEKK